MSEYPGAETERSAELTAPMMPWSLRSTNSYLLPA